MTEAINAVVSDRRRFDPESLGHALGARLLGALHEQDLGTLARSLAIDLDDPQQSFDSDAVRWMAATRAGAVSIDLPTQLSGSPPREVDLRPPFQGVPSDEVAGVIDGLATILAAQGYEPDQIFEDALASPLDVPGALFIPAYALQLLFAYIDGGGLGPFIGQSVTAMIGGGPAAAAPEPALLAAAPAYA